MREGDGLVADSVAQRAREVLDGEGAIGEAHLVRDEGRAGGFRCVTERGNQQRHCVFRIGREHQIDRREPLVVHAPAIVDLVVDRDTDDLRVRPRRFRGLQRPGEIDPVEAEDNVGLRERCQSLGIGGQHRGRAEMQRMIGREARRCLQAGDDARAERFGKTRLGRSMCSRCATRARPASRHSSRPSAALRPSQPPAHPARSRPAA